MNDGEEIPTINKAKAILSRRVCFACSTPIDSAEIKICPACGSQDLDDRRSRPTMMSVKRAAPALPHPWHKLKLKLGGSVLISGNAGSGKTSTCLKLRPTRFMASEQEIIDIKENWIRIVQNNDPDAPVPMFSTVSSWDDVEQDLVGISEDDIIILDSISQLASPHNVGTIVKRCIERVRLAGARIFIICQFTKAGDMLGPNELRHAVDVLAEIPDDNTGMRRLAFAKNRFGGLSATYFALDDTGVIPQEFDCCYTVEGSAGNYRLELYPGTGAKWDGIFKDLDEAGVRLDKTYASSAKSARIYRTGYAEPPDVKMRRRFAEEHGLTWITPQDAATLTSDPTLSAEDIIGKDLDETIATPKKEQKS